MADIDSLIATGVQPPASASTADQAMRLGQVGYYNTQSQIAQANANYASQRQQLQQKTAQLYAKAMNPTPPVPGTTSDALGPVAHPLLNRTDGPVDAAPTLGAIGTPAPAASAQIATPQSGAAPAAPDLSPAAGRQRFVAAAIEAGLPPDLVIEQLKMHDANTASQVNDLKLQQDARDARDRDIEYQANIDADGDATKKIDLMLKRGATPLAINTARERDIALQGHLMQLPLDALKAAQAGHEAMGESLNQYADNPDMKFKIEHWPEYVQQQAAAGHITKEEAANAPPAYPGDAAARKLAIDMNTVSEAATKTLALRTADREDAQAAETKRHNQATEAQAAVPKTDPELALAAAGGDPAKAMKLNTDAKIAARPVTTFAPLGGAAAAGGDGKPPLTGTEFLATLKPSQAARVKAIAEGRESPITGFGAAKGEGAAIMAAVEQYDPSWSAQRAQLRKAFMTGPDGRNIGALNTATVHLDQLHEVAKAMNNHDWQPTNQLFNYWKQKLGLANVTNYKYVMNALAGETASALKGAATDPEIAHVMATMPADLSPAQMEGVALNGLHVLGAKLQTYNERYHQQSPDDPWTPVLPSARAVYSRYGLDPTATAATVAAPASPSAAPKATHRYNPATGQIEVIK